MFYLQAPPKLSGIGLQPAAGFSRRYHRTIMKKIRWGAALLAVCFLWGQATPPADPQKAANERRDYIKAHYTKHEFLIPMRDGVRLFTSIYRPKGEGEKYPLLLSRTPYTVAPYGDDN